MATIDENITTLNNIKADIKAAIIAKGVEAGDDITAYGDKIQAISGETTVDTNDYLCFECVEDATIGISCSDSRNRPNIEYSFNKSSWKTWDFSDIAMTAGDKLYMRGNNPYGFNNQIRINKFVITTGEVNASGNINSLLSKSDFDSITDLTSYSTHTFVSVFSGCTALYTPPKFPATTLSSHCYDSAFYNCTSLQYIPDLPATTLSEYCYYYMFYGCTSIKEAVLPATTLVGSCYNYMFQNCSILQYIKSSFTVDPGYTYTYAWVDGVASTGCFIKAKSASWTTKSIHECPEGWTLITSVS